MISIIVCSVNNDLFSAFSENAASSIGVPFEIIRIDNSSNQYSICSAYNEGVSKAHFELLCFCHEDIILHTIGWGVIVQKIFTENPVIGLFGIAGSKYKAFAPSGWGRIPVSRYVNIIQRSKIKEVAAIHDRQNPDQSVLPRVVSVDGVFMCTRRSIALLHKFDDKIFTGFHCYDLDYCLNLFGKYEVAVTFDILLEHFSEGRNDADWIRDTMKLHEKWKNKLPANLSHVGQDLMRKYEFREVKHFMSKMIACHFSSASIMRMLHYNADNPYLSARQLKSLKLKLVRRFVRLKRKA